jgi:hypothetical protein
MTPPPISFSEKVKQTAKGGGYPVQLSASDLDQNFIYATLDIPEADAQGLPQPFLVSDIVGPSGKTQRQLTFTPAAVRGSAFVFSAAGNFQWLTAPTSGTHVLGAVDGALQWIATEAC